MNPHAMTPDELLAWAVSAASHPDYARLCGGIVHLHGEYARLKVRCARLVIHQAEWEGLKLDLLIANDHLDAYRMQTEQLRGLLDAATKAPWETDQPEPESTS